MNKKFGNPGDAMPPSDSDKTALSENTAPQSETSSVIPSRKRGVMTWLPWLILGVILVGLIVGILLKRIKDSRDAASVAKPAAVTPMVSVEPAALDTLQQTLQVTGNLRSNQDVNLGSKISGRVARVLVNEGDRVKRGQVLVQLDDKDLRAQVDQARAGVLTAQAQVKQAQANYPSTKAQVESGVVQAEAALQQAKAKLRQAQLNEPNQTTALNSQLKNAQEAVNVAESRVAQAQQSAKLMDQQTQSAVKSAQANVDRAKAALDEVVRGSRTQQIAQAQASVNLAQAQLNNAKVELERQKTLFAGGAAAKQSVDTAETNYQVAKAQLESAKQNLSLIKEGATSEDVRQAQAAYSQAQAALSEAQAGRAQVGVAKQDVISAQAQLAQAKAALRTAQANLAQIPITKETTREAREQVASAEAALKQAKANRAQLPVAQQNIAVAQAGLQSAKARLEQAQVDLAYAKITSPVDGVVVKKSTNAGETTSPGAALMQIVALDSVYFEAQVSEKNLIAVTDHQPVSVTIPSVANKPLQGYVSEIIPVADQASRQFRIRVTIPSEGKVLTPGAFARGVITTRAIEDTLAVPSVAVHQLEGQSVVYVAEGSGDDIKIVSHPVKTGMEAEGKTQILSGLKVGDKVITSQEELTVGAKVQISEFAL